MISMDVDNDNFVTAYVSERTRRLGLFAMLPDDVNKEIAKFCTIRNRIPSNVVPNMIAIGGPFRDTVLSSDMDLHLRDTGTSSANDMFVQWVNRLSCVCTDDSMRASLFHKLFPPHESPHHNRERKDMAAASLCGIIPRFDRDCRVSMLLTYLSLSPNEQTDWSLVQNHDMDHVVYWRLWNVAIALMEAHGRGPSITSVLGINMSDPPLKFWRVVAGTSPRIATEVCNGAIARENAAILNAGLSNCNAHGTDIIEKMLNAKLPCVFFTTAATKVVMMAKTTKEIRARALGHILVQIQHPGQMEAVELLKQSGYDSTCLAGALQQHKRMDLTLDYLHEVPVVEWKKLLYFTPVESAEQFRLYVRILATKPEEFQRMFAVTTNFTEYAIRTSRTEIKSDDIKNHPQLVPFAEAKENCIIHALRNGWDDLAYFLLQSVHPMDGEDLFRLFFQCNLLPASATVWPLMKTCGVSRATIGECAVKNMAAGVTSPGHQKVAAQLADAMRVTGIATSVHELVKSDKIHV